MKGDNMSELEKAARQALEALQCHADVGIRADRAINALRQALEQPKQEPVAWGAFYFGGKRNGKLYSACDTKEQIEHYIADKHQSDDCYTFRAAPLYTEPPQREPLTDEQERKALEQQPRREPLDIQRIKHIATYCGEHITDEDVIEITRRVEAAHGIGEVK